MRILYSCTKVNHYSQPNNKCKTMRTTNVRVQNSICMRVLCSKDERESEAIHNSSSDGKICSNMGRRSGGRMEYTILI